ncbi:hypothetical protein [Geminocystis sp. NIES-3709]|uniref:hypothetical protein n=1 Tax=Geminocystis sp. NIES-3709 TaxID=1617448 RepID=UPI0008261259|nr:hypothetical protein [Geminocystis sp. NIES-3709]
MIHDPLSVSRDDLATIRYHLFSLLDDFYSLEGNYAIIDTFFEKLNLNTSESELNVRIIESELSDLKANLDGYKEAIKQIYALVKELD